MHSYREKMREQWLGRAFVAAPDLIEGKSPSVDPSGQPARQAWEPHKKMTSRDVFKSGRKVAKLPNVSFYFQVYLDFNELYWCVKLFSMEALSLSLL